MSSHGMTWGITLGTAGAVCCTWTGGVILGGTLGGDDVWGMRMLVLSRGTLGGGAGWFCWRIVGAGCIDAGSWRSTAGVAGASAVLENISDS